MNKMMVGPELSPVLQEPPPPGCTKDAVVFDSFTFIPPPSGFTRRHEPELALLLGSLELAPSNGRATALDRYIDSKWMANVTVLDLEYEANRYRHTTAQYSEEPGMEWMKLEAAQFDPLKTLQKVLSDAEHANDAKAWCVSWTRRDLVGLFPA